MIIKLTFLNNYIEKFEIDKIEVFKEGNLIYFGKNRDRQEILSTLKGIEVEDN